MNKQQLKKGLVTLFQKKSNDFADNSRQPPSFAQDDTKNSAMTAGRKKDGKSSSKNRSTSRSHGGNKSIESQPTNLNKAQYLQQMKQVSKFQSIVSHETSTSMSRDMVAKAADLKQLSQKIVQRPQTQIALRSHNEYNNNEEDYTKAKKDQLLTSILKGRLPAATLSPSKTFEGDLNSSPLKTMEQVT